MSQIISHIVDKSKELLNRQIITYRTLKTNAVSLLGFISIFTPIFLFIIEKAKPLIQLLSIVPIVTITISIIMLMWVIQPQDLFQGYNEDQFDDLINDDISQAELFEIGANKESIKKYDLLLKKIKKKYIWVINRLIEKMLEHDYCALYFHKNI